MKRGDSLQESKSAVSRSRLAGIAVTMLLLLIYVATLMPGVPPTDSGELILAAWSGGVAHAPGFPLYTALGWLWSHLLPFGRIAWRLNLLSAVCGALAGGLTYALALRTLRGTGRTAETVTTNTIVSAAIGALALGLGRTVWSWATVAEVYTLTLALAAAILLLLVASGRANGCFARSRGAGEQRSVGTGAGAPGIKKPRTEGKRSTHERERPSGQSPWDAPPTTYVAAHAMHLAPRSSLSLLRALR